MARMKLAWIACATAGGALAQESVLPESAVSAPPAPEEEWKVSAVSACYGKQLSLKKCMMDECPRQCLPVDCALSVWSVWSPPDCTGLCTRHRGTDVANNECGTPCMGSLIETKRCKTPCHKDGINCAFGAWTAWEVCGVGMSQRSRNRQIITPEAIHGGRACEGNMLETAPCPKPMSTICHLSEWVAWSACSVNCGSGQQSRTRAFANQASDIGDRCVGLLAETQPCEGAGVGIVCETHVDCEWDAWTSWSGCTCSCAGGQKTRDRHIKIAPKGDGALCAANDRSEMEPCNTQPCSSGVCIDGRWGEWSRWGMCSAPCGGGLQWRRRTIAVEASECGTPATGMDQEVISCNNQSCTLDEPCVFSEWTEWSACSCSCDGVKRRLRRVASYGKGNGEWCVGPTKEIDGCNSCSKGTDPPVNCELGHWSPWSKCSVTCGTGQHDRYRSVKTEPMNGGSLCNAPLGELQQCTLEVCPVAEGPKPCVWGDWATWGACDKCGGQRKRNRQILQMAGEGGQVCSWEASEETQKCKRQCHEPVFCEWGAWEDRSECSVPCGKGTERRGRYLQPALALGRGFNRRLYDQPMSDQVMADDQPMSDQVIADERMKVNDQGSCDGDQVETVPCEKAACPSLCTPINCALHEWSGWSASDCTGLCTRHRGTKQSNNECGTPCSGSLIETKRCATTCHHAPTNCGFGAWNQWAAPLQGGGGGPCSPGTTQKERTREIITPADLHGGEACNGKTKEIAGCPMPPVTDCKLNEWSHWTECSQDCGPGQRNRMRDFAFKAIDNGDRCVEPLRETEPCNKGPCGDNRDCLWADWTSWGGCTCTCGGGQETRDRFIKVSPLGDGALCPVSDRTQIQSCNTQPCSATLCVDGKWSDWTPFGKCTVGCGGGVHWKSRKIMQEATDCGMPVSGRDKEFQPCNAYSCTVDQACVFDIWSDWSDCSCTQNGVKRRSRRIASYGKGRGAWCNGHTKEITGCNFPPTQLVKARVPCQWGLWDSWSACSVTCGSGQSERKREIAVEPMNGGSTCAGPLSQIEQCATGSGPGGSCPVPKGPEPCEWGEWMEWGACDKCGGQRKRNRQIIRMPEEGGAPCVPGASEETEKCKRECHKQMFCAWNNWESEGACSVSCGVGTVKRVRYLQVSAGDETLPVIEDAINEAEIYDGIDHKTSSDNHLREVMLSFACGSVASFMAVLVVMLAVRSRHSTSSDETEVLTESTNIE